jgi:uncharacterized protein (DUF952 family)
VLIYKILLPSQWAEFEAEGSFAGSPFDHESGFIHCSSRTQLAGTAQRVFAGEPELVVLTIEANNLGEAVLWELAPSRGESFPHIYGILPMSAVTAVHRVLGADAMDETLP